MHAPFCHACGRIISRTTKAQASDTLQKYCSKTCKTSKPGAADIAIEARFLHHLVHDKVDRRTGVPCSVIQEESFGTASEGKDKARERERVRRAGRRIVVFPERLNESSLHGKTLECVQNGKAVEGSFAKGEWGVRIVE